MNREAQRKDGIPDTRVSQINLQFLLGDRADTVDCPEVGGIPCGNRSLDNELLEFPLLFLGEY